MARFRQAMVVLTKRVRVAIHEDGLLHRELADRRRAENMERLRSGVSSGPAPSYPLN